MTRSIRIYEIDRTLAVEIPADRFPSVLVWKCAKGTQYYRSPDARRFYPCDPSEIFEILDEYPEQD